MVWLKRDSLRRRSPQHSAPKDESKPSTLSNPLDQSNGFEPSQQAIGRLRRWIEEGRLPVGARLPAERALALELGVGRPALREAIKVFSGLGILESRRGSGTFLKRGGAMPDLASVQADVGAAEFGVLDLLEVRKILEPRVAWLAATRANEKQLLEIENARNRLEMHDHDWKVIPRLDYELHAAVFRGANNPALLHIYEFLMSRILQNPAEKVRFAPDLQAMRNSHKAIVEAILKRQADVAEKAMIDHLHSVGMNIIREASR